MTKLTLKPLGLLVLPFVCIASLKAQTVADPVGVVKVTIAAAPAAGQSKLTAISATLRGAIDYQGTATSIGTFATTSQPLNTGVTTWTATQWTAEPHLCYIENAAGAEEAYLITANTTAGVLTLATSFDLDTRYPTTATFRICKAQTFGSLFGTSSVPFLTANSSANADNIHVWDGGGWVTYHHNGSSWQSPATAFGGDANDTVIFPDEGLFVLRRATTAITLTLNGSVPTKTQISTISGGSLSFVSNRYPVGTTLNSLGFHNLANWGTAASEANADVAYVWNGTDDSWTSYWHNGSSWQSAATAFGGDANGDAIVADSAIFILRRSTSTAANSPNAHALPYTIGP